jgi:Gas vesicle synthesis protein GvpL/GvpF
MIWVYAVCDRPEQPPPRRRGLAQAPLDAVVEGPLLAVFTRHVHSPSEPALDALWVHERVVDRLMTEHTVLPMRFGTRLASEDDLRRVLRERRGGFVTALDRVRGRVELGVRALRAAAAEDGAGPLAAELPAPPATGRDYLLGKLRNGRQADGAAAALHEPLAALAVEARRHPPRSPQEVLRASYLVERAVVARFRAAVERLQAAHPTTGILCTGPWPAYSFVGDAAPRAAADRPIPIGG